MPSSSVFNVNLPFFSYGIFRPGEISFLGIKEYVSSAIPIRIAGDLVLRDGVTLYKESNFETVDGFLISFKPEWSYMAYQYIDSLEPKKLYSWREINVDGISMNILYGVKPDLGSDDIREAEWKTIWDDPFFNSAMEVLDEMPEEKFDWNLKSLFRIQMKYMLLWTIIERFTFLRYSFGAGPAKRNIKLSTDKYFKEALLKIVKREAVIISSEDPQNKYTLKKNNPKKAIDYYYQVRCNISHRGKAVINDFETVDFSFNELLKITKYILEKTQVECYEIRMKYQTAV